MVGVCECECECEFLVRCGRERAKKEEKEREGGRTIEKRKGKERVGEKAQRGVGRGQERLSQADRSSVGLGWKRAADPLEEATDTVSQCTVLESGKVTAAQRTGGSALDSALARPVGRSNTACRRTVGQGLRADQ